jgi:hypothetical protein
MIPGWPYSVVAALEPGRTSWTAVLDAVRLGPDDDEAAVTAAQVRDVITRLIEAGHWREGDPAILVVSGAGYDVTRLSFLLADLPAQVLGRLRSDHLIEDKRRPPCGSRCNVLAGPGLRCGQPALDRFDLVPQGAGHARTVIDLDDHTHPRRGLTHLHDAPPDQAHHLVPFTFNVGEHGVGLVR